MSTHVLLHLLNELVERDKMQGLSCILSLFSNEFNEFINTRFCHYVRNVITFPENLSTTSGLSILLHGVISLPDVTSYDKNNSNSLL